ncbi:MULTISPECIES: DUF6544 family protein [unclassified Spirillospora]|uniref:DUF6544 family protein n=1 Tax=unclassified Spirillospora TaxID=2642701 RepID=UPI00371CAC31
MSTQFAERPTTSGEVAEAPRKPVPVPRLTAAARRGWRDLATPSEPGRPYDPDMVRDLPAPARRWLNHAIRAGTPLRGAALLEMRGRIRLGAWWPSFHATQILSPPSGFVWAATAHAAGLTVRGYDRYSGGKGEMRWRLMGAVPVMSAKGPDISLSAAGRLASEFVFVPAVALSPAVRWEPVDDQRARAHVAIAGRDHAVTLTVAPDGALRVVSLPRWGSPGNGPFREHPFSVIVEEEAAFGGYTIPSTVSAGWSWGSERQPAGEFIRFTLDRADHF